MNPADPWIDRILTEINELVGLTISRAKAQKAKAYVRDHPDLFQPTSGMSSREAADLAIDAASIK